MSETSDPIDSGDLDFSSRQVGLMENPPGNNPIALDGSMPSIHSVSLVLQALLPLIVSLVFLFAGRRLYRFTTTASVALSSALFTWALFVNLESGQSIGNWTGEVAAVTVWSVMMGGSLIGSLIGYQLTWWGAHVTGRLCLGANSGVSFAFSVLLTKSGLLIHTSGGQWSLVGASAVVGIIIVLWDHVMGPLVAITACGSFLFLLGIDMFNTLGLDGVAAGLRLLLDHNPDHSMYITSYNPPKSTIILIIVSWVIGFISLVFQYACYSVPFGPLTPTGSADEEQGVDESKTKESLNELKNAQPSTNKQFLQSEGESATTDPSQAVGTNTDRGSNEASDGTKTSGTLIDTNAPPGQIQEPSILPYLSSRPTSGPAGECGSPAALALSPTVYSRYRRTQDPIHKPPSRTPIQYQFHSNLISFNNPRRVETVDEVTESSASVLGVEPPARSSIITASGTSNGAGKSNSMSEEYLNAMMYLAYGECKLKEDDGPEIVSIQPANNQDNCEQRVGEIKARDDAPPSETPNCENAKANDLCDQEQSQVGVSAPRREEQASITSNTSSPLDSQMVPIVTKAQSSSTLNPSMSEVPSATQPNQSSVQEVKRHSKIELARPLNSRPGGQNSSSDSEIQISRQVKKSQEGERSASIAGSSRVLSNTQSRCDDVHSSSPLFDQSSQDLATLPQSRIRNAFSDRDPDSSTLRENRSSKDNFNGRHDFDAVGHKRFSNRPLPLTPSQQRPKSYDRATVSDKPESAPKMGKVIDNRSLQSSNSNASMLDSYLRVHQDSSVPTTPSTQGKTLQEDHKPAESVYVPTRKRLSIAVGNQPQLPRRTSTRTQNSQEAQIIDLPDHSPAINNTAVPHTPTLGNMLLRVSEGAEKPRKQPDFVHSSLPVENNQAPSNHIPIADDLDEGDAATIRSENSRRSTICMSSICADHTSAEEGGKSCSESEEGDDGSHEQYFDPRRIQQLNKALGEWSNLFSDELATEDGTEGSHTSSKKNDEQSPSLHSIPLPSQQNKPGSSHDLVAQNSMDLTPVRPIPFVGEPLAEVPWPQMRSDRRKSGTSNGVESNQKRWTTASSIFPPIGYESSTESPTFLKNQDEDTDSYPSDTGPDRIGVARNSRISNETLTSFEGGTSQKKPPGMFCSASSHIADDHDMSDVTSRVGETTDEEDLNYESAADYNKSIRKSGPLSASDHDYFSSSN